MVIKTSTDYQIPYDLMTGSNKVNELERNVQKKSPSRICTNCVLERARSTRCPALEEFQISKFGEKTPTSQKITMNVSMLKA